MAITNSTIQIQDSLIRQPLGQGSVGLDVPRDFEEQFRSVFNMVSGCPAISIGNVPDPENFSRNTRKEGLVKIEALPIKQFNNDTYSIPRELVADYGKTIDAIFQNQFDRNSLAYHFKGAILWIQRSYVGIDACQRAPSWHLDSPNALLKTSKGQNLLHAEILPSTKITPQIYVVSDRVTTQVQSAPVRNTDIFKEGADRNRPVREGVIRNLDPYEIGLMNGDTWHRGSRAETAGMRNFLALMLVGGESMESAVQQGVFRQKETLALSFD